MPETPKDTQRDTILDSIADGVFTVDGDWRITSFNRAAERITGVPRAEAIGQRCCDVFRASICETDCALRRTMETGKPIVNKAIYIVDAHGERVPISISTALLKDDAGRVIGGVETFRDLSLVEELRKELDGRHVFEDIVSRSHRMQQLFDILPEVARSNSTVLIEGESGTGKELFARAIHNLSPRRRKRLVTVNCGALPDTLLESELFGHKAGAFTDAKRDRKGRFALADGGTIFLDEIGDVSPALQVRLLRVLQDGTYEPLGGTEPQTADVRVITATNRNLDELVAQGRFRQDLYYRINVVRLALPPLRERKEDVPLLVEHFITHFNRLREKDVTGISPEVLAILMEHDYPGNVRELENILEHAFVLCPGGMIEPRHLPDRLRPADADRPQLPRGATTLKEIEARFIRDALARNDWNRLATARELGIHKSTLFRKIKSLGIQLPAQDGRTRSE
jgi:PAS domain S-box-containing protein